MNGGSAKLDGSTLPPTIRAIIRAEDDYLIRRMDEVCGKLMKGDYLRAYIWIAMCVLNVRHITRGGDGLRYAALYDFPPDSQRRPVSIVKLAEATRLPYETVRRRTHLLIRDGICALVPGKGVVVPTAVFQQTEHIDASRAVLNAAQRLIADLQRAQFDFSQLQRASRRSEKNLLAIARAFIRLDADYTLDVIDIIRAAHDGDPVEAVLFTAVATENTRHLGAPPRNNELAPDALRRPVSALAASSSMNIPYETLRRMFVRMTKAGRLVRVKDGYIVPAAVQAEIQSEAVLERRYQRLVRFLDDLQSIGMPMPGDAR